MTSGLKILAAELLIAFGFNISIEKKKTLCYVIFPEVQPHVSILNQEIVMTLPLNSTFHQLEKKQDVNQSLENLGFLKLDLF